jgi:hypothetical protein
MGVSTLTPILRHFLEKRVPGGLAFGSSGVILLLFLMDERVFDLGSALGASGQPRGELVFPTSDPAESRRDEWR